MQVAEHSVKAVRLVRLVAIPGQTAEPTDGPIHGVLHQRRHAQHAHRLQEDRVGFPARPGLDPVEPVMNEVAFP